MLYNVEVTVISIQDAHGHKDPVEPTEGFTGMPLYWEHQAEETAGQLMPSLPLAWERAEERRKKKAFRGQHGDDFPAATTATNEKQNHDKLWSN